ncbi:efflux RND transporter periplasmic adaptor subunit [Giesbergeria anulus]|uniref:RND family efflux transporter, MFP subunit n=1 Tax=Giesbergeria anulus TaxID=180197 RepID=A0A1H9HQG8_9BURK|nr:efflux RND transporter periplasmic adaptor subunit [Giesbergeria anulus]SEQ64528.1 RND family efflux transporter, MFP subunit [Giesbergeria anulus]
MSSLPAPPSRKGLFWVCAATFCLAACSRPEPAPEPLRAVKLLTVGANALQAQQEYAGEVRARTESRLGFRVAGKIMQRPAELGAHVRPGELLAQLDPQDYQLAAQAAQAQVTAAQTQQELAAADYQRYARLQAQNFISGAELERRETTLKAAQATLAQSRAQAAAQSNQTGYTRLLADVAGVITAIEAEPGQVVTAGAPVLRLAHDGPRDVVFAAPEDKVSALRTGQAVQVRPWVQGALLQGRIREVAASADPTTRTYAVKVALEGANPPALGATVYVLPQSLGRAGQTAITLPTTALLQQGNGTAVWVYDPATSTVRLQKIEVATADGNAAVVASGLTPGMQVVATGVHVLSPGQKVTVYQPKTGVANGVVSSQH